MQKSIESLMQKIAQSADKTIVGGFHVIRGGVKVSNDHCNNMATCPVTNIGSCTNSGDCSNGSNPGVCDNSGTCAF